MRCRFVCLAVATAASLWMSVWVLPAVAKEELTPPTGERDLVVFVAREKPDLYRLVGQEPMPYGTARFSNPKAIVADPERQCFYVFDVPPQLAETRKIWRIDAQGNATLVFEGHRSDRHARVRPYHRHQLPVQDHRRRYGKIAETKDRQP